MLLTAVAPVTWGASYLLTSAVLPPGSPLWGGVIRALPAGLVLLAIARRLPSGSWWWRAPLLGTMTIGAFFVLIYVAAQRLPSSLASTLMAASPAVMLALAWPLLGQRPGARATAGAGLGFLGVGALVLTGGGEVDPIGVAASLLAMTSATIGFLLATRWGAGGGGPGAVDPLSLTAWQLLGGGLVVVPVALAVEGAPPRLTTGEIAGFGVLTLVATALAYAVWFGGLRRLDAGTVGLIGLLNPLTGAVLGTMVAGERLGPLQVVGVVLVLAGVGVGVAAARTTSRPDTRAASAQHGGPSPRMATCPSSSLRTCPSERSPGGLSPT